MTTPVNPLGPACWCQKDPCVCFIMVPYAYGSSYASTSVLSDTLDGSDHRPRKTPLFVPPLPPAGYQVQYQNQILPTSNDGSWYPLRMFGYRDPRTGRWKRVWLTLVYRSKIVAERMAERARTQSEWKRPVRVVAVDSNREPRTANRLS